MNSLLFSLPGAPVLYYGDEIGMGDNIYIGDRNGVRTPMQWSSDRNAGFSRVNPQQLYLPVITDPEYHYETLNVEQQTLNQHSLYWWTRRLIAPAPPATGLQPRQPREFLPAAEPSRAGVPACATRRRTLLVVANLSRFVQQRRAGPARWRGWTPVELFGGMEMAAIEAGRRYPPATLGPHNFFWFSLERQRAGRQARAASRRAGARAPRSCRW